jgi:hypothetical protein
MAMAFTAQTIAQAREYVEKAQTRMKTFREKAEERIGQGLEVTEVSGTAFALGYANARWGEDGEIKLLGVPLDLGAGAALTGLALFGGLGKYAEHGVNIGAGALAAYGYRAGFELGSEAQDDDEQAAQKKSAKKTAAAARMGAARPTGYATAGVPGETYAVYEQH